MAKEPCSYRLQLGCAIIQQDHFVLRPQLLPDDICQALVIGFQVLCIIDAYVHRRGFFILGDSEVIDSRHLGDLLVQSILYEVFIVELLSTQQYSERNQHCRYNS